MSGGPDIAALRAAIAGSGGRAWGGLEDPALSGDLADLLGDEFASFRQAALGADRREFLRIMTASLALAGLAGCSPERSDDAIPYVIQPEEVVPGKPSLYATAVTLEGYAQPVLAMMHRGRPTKLEGNPEHPAAQGRTDLFAQAAILDLYDPDRSPNPLNRGETATFNAFDRLLPELRSRWRESAGEGLRLLVGGTTSPTLLRQLADLVRLYPKARIHAHQPIGPGESFRAATLAFGRPLEMLPRLDRARVVVSLDDDLLGPGPRQVWNIRHWATRRGAAASAEERVRLHVAEPTPSQTGAVANHRLAVPAGRIAALAAAIASRLGLGDEAPELSWPERAFAERAADALRTEAGRSLITVGAAAPAEIQALAFGINAALGNAGRTIVAMEPIALASAGPVGGIVDLARDLAAGRVDTLAIIDANPAYDAPADLGFADLVARAKLTIHAGTHADETARLADWHLPLPHALETWSDARAVDGTATLLQPLIAPLYASRSVHELLAGLMGGDPPAAREIVKATWRERFGAGFEAAWIRALHDGFVADSRSRPVEVAARTDLRVAVPRRAPGIEAVLRPDPTIWDGRFANNAWLQELGKPLTKTAWENVVRLSPKLAQERGLTNGDRVRITAGSRSVEGPVWVMPGQAERSVTLHLGYGRRSGGKVCEGIGYDATPIRASDALWTLPDVSLTKLDGRSVLAVTQATQAIEGEDLIRTVSARALDASKPKDREQASIYPERPRGETAWGMVIDLDLCSGCNACVVACQAENNIPVVGQDQVARGRQMHWLRVDRYYSGDIDEPDSAFQPVPCMHCEQAPCEMGCPVHATVHSTDGLNQMVYNRCIGTRTCSSYCPYKVRRFNWYDYTSGAAEAVIAQRNPDVTVRGRGVMEKCTYCVQRIRGATAEADLESRKIRDGEVVTACQQACPSRAITFGNLADPGSAVAAARSGPRNYALLAELGTRPRTTYLARIADEEPG